MQTIWDIGRIAKNKINKKNILIHNLTKKIKNPDITPLILIITHKNIIRTVTKHITFIWTIKITIINIRTISIETK